MNQELSKLKPYVGSWEQLFSLKEYEFASGRAKGVKGFDVKNGGGLQFTVIDRTMDITELSYRGETLSFLSPRGVCAPEYASEKGMDFLENFTCGAVMTCGLNTIGSPSTDEGAAYGLHGKLPTLRGEQIGAWIDWEGETPCIWIRGKLNHAWLYGEKLELCREIRCVYGEKRIHIHDRVHNHGFRDEPFFLLYHINLGYPLVSEDSYVLIPSDGFIPGNEISGSPKEMEAYDKCQAPVSDYPERVFFHKLRGGRDGSTCAALINPQRELGIAVRSNVREMPRLTQWKYMREGEYVVGLSPANSTGFGRGTVRAAGEMEVLRPEESRDIHITFEILDGAADIECVKKEISAL